ncbi:hypothetical protein BB559_003938 [Furculomyces boomerangus]|uniref:Ubiquitin carboxyl-terminal hydrolase n=1 Tax=Furculomyces boomerangus TaxID=61424 RepID=A0A2T9YHT4_9FUNG|nr:hypothetical protein BB559_003938 [Furculomyces boomerangus]
MEEHGNWCLIESDPGVFTELISNMGVQGIQVEELWSLDTDFSELGTVYGIIFLFKWEANQSSNSSDSQRNNLSNNDLPEDLIFMKQIVNNACATQAILSILLNNNEINLGPELDNFKDFIKSLTPELRGMVLSNSETIRSVHNSFARQALIINESVSSNESEDLFHFVSYIPFNNSVYKLDGLQHGPIRINDIPESHTKNSGKARELEWSEVAIENIKQVINNFKDKEIRFNLMAITKDRRIGYNTRIDQIKNDLKLLQKKLESLKLGEDDTESIEKNINILISEKNELQNQINYQNEKLHSYSIENARRKHNFVPMIKMLAEALAKSGNLENAIKKARKS